MALFLGLISGTSMDAIDAALVDIDGARVRLLEYREMPYPEPLLQRLERLVASGAPIALNALGSLDAAIGRAFAAAAQALLAARRLPASAIVAIGSHGQTIAHGPDCDPPFSLQIGDPSTIAYRTGITTVADFRRKDIAAGGQGAPLVAAFHAVYFGSAGVATAVANIGGIANVSLLPKAGAGPVLAFDTGPGNTLLDAWCRRHLGRPYDADGRWAATGQASGPLVQVLMADPYFAEPAPKSTGRDYFNLAWLDRGIAAAGAAGMDPADVQASLVELSAETLAGAIRRLLPDCTRIAVCGGGARNGALMEALQRRAGRVRVLSTLGLGLPPEAVEAVAFAWLAQRRLALEAGNLPAATGAGKVVILGGVYAPD